MAAGDVTKVPSGGLQFDFEITCIHGYQTTMYVGDCKGRVRSLTSTGTLADLTTKIGVNEKIVAIQYVSSSLIFVTDKGKIYTCATNGSSLTLLKDLAAEVKTAYYYTNFLYVVLDAVEPRTSMFTKVATA